MKKKTVSIITLIVAIAVLSVCACAYMFGTSVTVFHGNLDVDEIELIEIEERTPERMPIGHLVNYGSSSANDDRAVICVDDQAGTPIAPGYVSYYIDAEEVPRVNLTIDSDGVIVNYIVIINDNKTIPQRPEFTGIGREWSGKGGIFAGDTSDPQNDFFEIGSDSIVQIVYWVEPDNLVSSDGMCGSRVGADTEINLHVSVVPTEISY